MLPVPGRHNVYNALAAIAVGLELEIPFEKIAEAFKTFSNADRRFQFKGEANGITVVDDYGHHPTEVQATLAAAKYGSDLRRTVVVFQPHRYTRTQDLMEEFAGAFADCDSVFVLPIYAASEKPIEGVTAEALVARITGPQVAFAPDFAAAIAAVAQEAREGDLILTLGAGNVSQLAPQILTALDVPQTSPA